MEHYLDITVQDGIVSKRTYLQFQMQNLFEGVELRGRTVLDIGGGNGVYSFYAAAAGASSVLCLEPEAEGSTSRVIDTFQRLRERMGFDNVTIDPVTLQDFAPRGRTFDVVLLYNSINHLNEPACITLLDKLESREAYTDIFSNLYSLCARPAKLIVADCSRHNFFNAIGTKNPFNPTIEWHKHQAPELWAGLLSKVGFTTPRIRWSTFSRLGTAGKLFTGNRWAAYFLRSHFVLTMDRPRN